MISAKLGFLEWHRRLPGRRDAGGGWIVLLFQLSVLTKRGGLWAMWKRRQPAVPNSAVCTASSLTLTASQWMHRGSEEAGNSADSVAVKWEKWELTQSEQALWTVFTPQIVFPHVGHDTALISSHMQLRFFSCQACCGCPLPERAGTFSNFCSLLVKASTPVPGI